MPSEPVLCAIHQPNFLPRLSTLAKLYTVDHWIVLDDVQFTRRDYQHRCRLAALGDPTAQRWLSLPVRLPGGRGTAIRDVTLAEPSRSCVRVAGVLRQLYGRGADRSVLEGIIEEITATMEGSDRLLDVAEVSTRALLRLLHWPGRVSRSSDFRVRSERSARLADLTTAVGADTYLCGTGGARYLDPFPFHQRQLTVEYFAALQPDSAPWEHATRLSALHTLMKIGPHDLRSHLQQLKRPSALPARAPALQPF
jgi:hypothetical protein